LVGAGDGEKKRKKDEHLMKKEKSPGKPV
jgi:hypothetical protein